MRKFRHRKPVVAAQVESGARKDMQNLPFASEVDYQRAPFRGVEMRESTGGCTVCDDWVRINKGDWIVKNSDGEIFITSDRYFRETFEEIVDSAQQGKEERMAKWIKVGDSDYVRESSITRVTLNEDEVMVQTDDGMFIAHSSDETTQDFIALFRALDIGSQA